MSEQRSTSLEEPENRSASRRGTGRRYVFMEVRLLPRSFRQAVALCIWRPKTRFRSAYAITKFVFPQRISRYKVRSN